MALGGHPGSVGLSLSLKPLFLKLTSVSLFVKSPMKSAIAPPLAETLETALKLAQDVQTHAEAHETFNKLYEALREQSPEVANLMQTLWREYVTTQRSAAFWQELCQVEKHLSERIAESHLQLRQNYLRLIQEQ